jgi:hypothetical protein
LGVRGTVLRVDRPDPKQVERYRAMTPAERWRQAQAIYEAARALRAAQTRAVHPDWSDARVDAHVRQVFLRAVS